MSRRYEMVLVADPAVPEPAHDEQITGIEALIHELGGVVHKIDRWGRMKMAYSIANRNEGNYTLLLYDGEPSVEKELLRRVRLSDTFIRFLSVRADEQSLPTVEEKAALEEARREHLRRAAEREQEREAEAATSDDEAAADSDEREDDDADAGNDDSGEEEE